MSRDVNLGEYLARVPSIVGYELDDHVVAIPTNSGRGGQMAATLQWETAHASERDLAEAFASAALRAARENNLGEHFILIGYGPHGRERAQQVSDALMGAADVPTPFLAHVQDGSWSKRLPGTDWSEPRPLPDMRAEIVAEGRSLPAASRSELARRYEPGIPQFGPEAPNGFIWQAHPPSFRAQIVTRALDQLARPAHRQDTARMAIVAHLMATDVVVRDAGIGAAATDPGRTAALVSTYQACPPQLRPHLAAAAATALCLQGESSQAVYAVLSHAPTSGPGATLAALTRTIVDNGINPHTVGETIREASQQEIPRADARWEELRRHYLGDRHPTPSARTLPGPAPRTLDASARPEPGEVTRWIRQHAAATETDQSGPTVS